MNEQNGSHQAKCARGKCDFANCELNPGEIKFGPDYIFEPRTPDQLSDHFCTVKDLARELRLPVGDLQIMAGTNLIPFVDIGPPDNRRQVFNLKQVLYQLCLLAEHERQCRAARKAVNPPDLR